jgi:hypothetical protein
MDKVQKRGFIEWFIFGLKFCVDGTLRHQTETRFEHFPKCRFFFKKKHVSEDTQQSRFHYVA